MRVGVELTFADYSEAMAAVRAVQIEQQRKRVRRSPATLVFAVAFALVTFFALQFLAWNSLDPLPGIRPASYMIITLMLPFAMLVVVSAIAVAVAQWGTPGRAIRRMLLILLPMTVIVLLSASLGWALTMLPRRPPGLPSIVAAPAGTGLPIDWYGTLLPHVPWVLVAVLFAWLAARGSRSQLRKAWEGQPALVRPKLYDLSVYGVSVDEQVTHRHYQWPAFVRWLETKTLLILCPSEMTFEILPKRFFASPEELDAARALMKGQIRDAEKTPAAFPVGAVAPPPPLAASQPVAPPALPGDAVKG
jgi:hypothetical protein